MTGQETLALWRAGTIRRIVVESGSRTGDDAGSGSRDDGGTATAAVYRVSRRLAGLQAAPAARSLVPPGGSPPVGFDSEACAAVRAAEGDDMTLMLDSSWSYSYTEALRVGLAIQDLGHHW